MRDLSEFPDIALSIQQPWAWLIVNGHKKIENRKWRTNFRGQVAIHAGQKIDYDAAINLQQGIHPVTLEDFSINTFQYAGKGTSGIVGVAEIVDCVEESEDEFFVGKYGFVIANARPIEFIPCKGALSFFKWKDRIIGH